MQNLVKFLDRHIAADLLEFSLGTNLYVESDILNAISTILKPTSLLEKRNAIQKKLNSSELPELSSLKSNLSALIDSGKLECQDIESLLADPELLALLESDKPAALIQLKGNNNLDEMLNNLFKYAKNLYQSGDYKKSAELLGHVSNLSSNKDQVTASLWGKLNSEILLKSKSTTSTFIKLRDEIEIDSTSSHLKKLEARTWLLHASLLVYIKINQDFESIVELFLQPQYANTIQSTCPYLLRYLTFCVISTKRRGAVKDLIKFGIEGSNDPIVDVAEAVFVSFDFNDAQVKLAESKVILEKDYFLSSVYEIFIQNAKSMIFEAYCRVYSTIDIGKMAVKLGMDPVEGKKWILEVISETGMDAKINEETNSITTGQHTMPVEQQIQERVNGLKIRAAALEELVADKIAENAD